jgi:hypothetical protein
LAAKRKGKLMGKRILVVMVSMFLGSTIARAQGLDLPLHLLQEGSPGAHGEPVRLEKAGKPGDLSRPFAFAAEENTFWLPVVINASGQAGSQWRSDVGILNGGTSAATVGLKLYRSGAAPVSASVNVAAGQQVILRDIVGTTLGATGKGPLEITSDQQLVVTSRTYNDSATGTFGQDYDGFAAGSGLSTGQSAWIGQLTQKNPYRTNIGLTNTGVAEAKVSISLYDASGTNLKTFQVTVAPAGFWQNEVFRTQLDRADLDVCFVKVTVDAGAGVLVHGSVIDGRTNDPTTFWAKTPDTQSFPAAASGGAILVNATAGQPWRATTTAPWVHLTRAEGVGKGIVEYTLEANDGSARIDTIEVDGESYTGAQESATAVASYSYWLPVATNGEGKLGSFWRSDAGLLSTATGTGSASVDLKLYPSGAAPVTRSVTLGAGQAQILADVIGRTFGMTGKGPLQITSSAPLVVTSRTYNSSADGTFGQDYDGFASTSGLSAGESVLISQLTQKAPYRSNLGLTNTGDVTAVVEVTLLDGSGVELKKSQVSLEPAAFWQEESFKTQAGRDDLDACYAKIAVLSGKGILAHGSVIDGRTNDPTTSWGKRAPAPRTYDGSWEGANNQGHKVTFTVKDGQFTAFSMPFTVRGFGITCYYLLQLPKPVTITRAQVVLSLDAKDVGTAGGPQLDMHDIRVELEFKSPSVATGSLGQFYGSGIACSSGFGWGGETTLGGPWSFTVANRP